MDAYREDIVNIELETGTVHRTFLNHAVGEGDLFANRFGIKCFRDGQEVSMAGNSCVGFFIRADGTTLVIQGGIVGSKAYVTLPEAAYAVEGNFTLAVKINDGHATTTMRIVDGTVVNTTLMPISDPATVVPDLSTLLEVIERAEDAADEIAAIHITNQQIEGTRYRIIVTKEE